MKRKILLEFDLSQAEAVAVAAYCGDPGMKKLFGPCFASNYQNGKTPEKIDCHLDRALMILEVLNEKYSYPEFKSMYVDSHPRAKQMRQAAKAVGVHATNYDVGPRTVITSLRHHDVYLNTAQESQLRSNTHSRFPGIRLYQTGVQQALHKTRILKTAKGMRRYFFSKLDANTYRRAYAFLPQCTVAEITNDAIVAMEEPIRELNGFVLLQVHDSVLVEVPERHVQTAHDLIYNAMVQPIEVYPFFGESDIMTIQVDCKWGTHWGELKTWKS
jgi:DNA polymerase I-like protein with 3'-5' exonuclease and polymerase domains